jgi:hypothetical protein
MKLSREIGLRPSPAALAAGRGRSERTRLAWALPALALGLGACQLLDFTRPIDPDGISYLEMGAAFMRGDWREAVNSLWSPLYAWMQGLAQWLLKPDPFWAFPTVHLVNFLIYGLALLGFRFFLSELINWQLAAGRAGEAGLPLSPRAWLWLGYTVFVWSSLKLINIRQESPDLLVAALVYLSLGLVLQIRRGPGPWQRFVLLGGVLGLAYWAKAFMFVLALLILAVSVIPLRRPRQIIQSGAVGLAAFLIVAAPLMGASLKL